MKPPEHYGHQAERIFGLLETVLDEERPMGRLIPSLREDAAVITALSLAGEAFLRAADHGGLWEEETVIVGSDYETEVLPISDESRLTLELSADGADNWRKWWNT